MAVRPGDCGAPTPVYAVAGEGGRRVLERLVLEPGIEEVDSPRHAGVLVIAGRVPDEAQVAVQRIHDQMPHPRACAMVGPRREATPRTFIDGLVIEDRRQAGAEIRRLYRQLLDGERPSSGARLPDEPPAPWQGRGDHGQGGEGMMGGKPYGRPMPMTDDDIRDGLSLDAPSASIGPFAPMLPPGLCLEVTMQGDVVQHARIRSAPYADESLLEPWHRALDNGASIRDLERLRAAHHLRCIARLLKVRGALAIALRALRLADEAETGRLGRLGGLDLRWLSCVCRLATDVGTGILPGEAREALAGPALRGAGATDDLRHGHEDYSRLGFRPVVQSAGDVRSRVWQWLAETQQSLALAALPDAARTSAFPAGIESPAGPLGAGETEAAPGRRDLERLLRGLEWSSAVSCLASFDDNTLHRMVTGAPA